MTNMTDGELIEAARTAIADDANGLAKMDPANAVAVYAIREPALARALLGLLEWRAALAEEFESRGAQGPKVWAHLQAAVHKRLAAGAGSASQPPATSTTQGVVRDDGPPRVDVPEGVPEGEWLQISELLRRRGKRVVDSRLRPSQGGAHVIRLHHLGCDDYYEVVLTPKDIDLAEDVGRLVHNRLLEAIDCPCGYAVEVK